MKIFYEKKALKGVGAMHHVLHSVVCICEYEYSHLHSTLCSARPCCRATPFKEKKSSLGGRKKAKPEKGTPSILRTPSIPRTAGAEYLLRGRTGGSRFYCLQQEIFEEIFRGNKAWSSFCRDKPLFPQLISSLISARRA